MIAVDTFEQMNAQSFKLVGAHAGHHGLARLVQIGVDFCLAQLPHGHVRDGNRLEHYRAIARDGNGGVQFVSVAGKAPQLLRGLCPTGRLAEKPFSQCQRLIRADDDSIGLARRNPKRFLAREKRRDFAGRRKTGGPLNLPLIDFSRNGLKSDAGISQQRLPRTAL